jgi:hypothetical protein
MNGQTTHIGHILIYVTREFGLLQESTVSFRFMCLDALSYKVMMKALVDNGRFVAKAD